MKRVFLYTLLALFISVFSAFPLSAAAADDHTVTQIPGSGYTGKSQLAEISGKDEYADFQMKANEGSLLYSWEFYGKDISEPADMDLHLSLSEKPFSSNDGFKAGDTLYLRFAEKADLPGNATLCFALGSGMPNDAQYSLYRYYSDSNTTDILIGNITPVNGYICVDIARCEDLILSVSGENTTGVGIAEDYNCADCGKGNCSCTTDEILSGGCSCEKSDSVKYSGGLVGQPAVSGGASGGDGAFSALFIAVLGVIAAAAVTASILLIRKKRAKRR